MVEYSKGSVSKHSTAKSLCWRGVIRYKDGDTWRTLSKVLTDEGGERIPARPGKDDNRGRAAAEKSLARWRDSLVAADTAQAQPTCSMPIPDYIDSYLDEIAPSIEPSTMDSYRSLARKMRAAFPDTPMSGMTTEALQSWENGMIDAGLSPATVAKCHRFARLIFRSAVKRHILPYSPADAVKPPKRHGAMPNALTVEGCRDLLCRLAGLEPTPVVVAAQIALYTGMRAGEVCGLKWGAVHVDSATRAGTLSIVGAIGQAGGRPYEKEPKNARSKCVVYVPAPLGAILERRRVAMSLDALELGLNLDSFAMDGLYVVGDVDGVCHSPAALSKEWRTLAEAWGITGTQGRRVTFHDLRHTFATLAIAGGADVSGTSAAMGHSTPSMTLNVYADAYAHSKQAVAKVVSDAITATDGAR